MERNFGRFDDLFDRREGGLRTCDQRVDPVAGDRPARCTGAQQQRPVVGEGIRGHVEDAHHETAVAQPERGAIWERNGVGEARRKAIHNGQMTIYKEIAFSL